MDEQPGKGISEKLPETFQVKYLGFRECKSLWGIKHTRGPVDQMVSSAKQVKTSLNSMKLIVSEDGCKLVSVYNGKIENRFFPIDSISYGVQDVVYNRVFSMIMVKQTFEFEDQSPFECHAFVSDSRSTARKLTYTLAAAFQLYSLKVRSKEVLKKKFQKFAIDLRAPEELENDLKMQDSEV